MVTHFPSVLQLLPECFRTPDTNLIPSQGTQRSENRDQSPSLSASNGERAGVRCRVPVLIVILILISFQRFSFSNPQRSTRNLYLPLNHSSREIPACRS